MLYKLRQRLLGRSGICDVCGFDLLKEHCSWCGNCDSLYTKDGKINLIKCLSNCIICKLRK